MISSDERDRLQTVHRRMLADEDHWIIDPRRISLAQTILYTSTWLVVVGAALFVWLVSGEVTPPMSWVAPLLAAAWLLVAGFFAARRREPLASAAFLAAGVLACVPATLAILRDAGWLSHPVAGVRQLFGTTFTNEQTLASLLVALGFSLVTWSRLRMTGFAWTTAALAGMNYIAVLLCFNWLDQKPEIMALWCLPLVAFDLVGLWSEKAGQVRWAIPFHLVGFVALVGVLDVMALHGPTLAMIGLTAERLPWFDPGRQQYLSFAANGYLFLWLMLLTEGSSSLDLRRASRWFEPLALLHILGALYANARAHRQDGTVMFDVMLYAVSVLLLLLLGPWRSRWRMFVGALGGVALGSHLLVDFSLVPKSTFTLTLGMIGLVISAGTYLYLQRSSSGKK